MDRVNNLAPPYEVFDNRSLLSKARAGDRFEASVLERHTNAAETLVRLLHWFFREEIASIGLALCHSQEIDEGPVWYKLRMDGKSPCGCYVNFYIEGTQYGCYAPVFSGLLQVEIIHA